MSEYIETQQKAEDLRKTKKYRLAIPKYKEIWDNFPDEFSKWDGWGYATCLLKERKYEEAYEVCHRVYEMDKNFVFNNSLYAWSIYRKDLTGEKIPTLEKLLESAQLIISITNQSESQSPYTKTVFRVLDFLDRQPVYDADMMMEWLEKVEYKKLPKEVDIYTNRTGKKISPASFYEQYFTYKAKTLYKKGLYQESIDLCKEAFETVPKFHNNNDIWLLRRVALANAKLGKTELALEQLNDILEENNRWFIMKDIADIHISLGNKAEAKSISIDAALLPGETSKKMKLFFLLAELYKEEGATETVILHAKLLLAIDQKKEVPHEDYLLDLCKEYQVDITEQIDVQEALDAVREIWQRETFKGKDPYYGKIERIQRDNGMGYIHTGGGKGFTLPFRLNEFLGNEEELVKAAKVSYYVADLFDRKKNRYLKHAVDVRVLPPPEPQEESANAAPGGSEAQDTDSGNSNQEQEETW